MGDSKIEYFPTRGGSFTAYDAEYSLGDGRWLSIPRSDYPKEGERIDMTCPYPARSGGICKEIGLMGKNQALAFMHHFAAVMEASLTKCEVRLVSYKILYDIKAQRINETIEQEVI